MYFLNAVYHLYQTCKLKHQSQQALLSHWYQVVCFQPAANKYKQKKWRPPNISFQNVKNEKIPLPTYLYIPMNMSLPMKIIQSFKGFFKNSTNCYLLKPIWICNLHKVQTRTLCHEWHDHPKVPLNNKRAISPYNIWMIYQAHCLSLPTYVILPKYSISSKVKKHDPHENTLK